MAERIRLDKLLCDIGEGTRTEIKCAAKKGRITVNGAVVKDTGMKIDPNSDTIFFDGNEVHYIEFEYIMLNKPSGVVSATEDNHFPTVIDLVECCRKDIFPVGRLDIDTEGLLLLTNDGELAHKLLSPKNHVEKKYYLETDSDIPLEAIAIMADGFKVDDELTALPSKLEIIHSRAAYLSIHEGKFHQVKRMMHAVGCEVTYLKRISMGNLLLDNMLKPGEYRNLSDEEILALKGCQ